MIAKLVLKVVALSVFVCCSPDPKGPQNQSPEKVPGSDVAIAKEVKSSLAPMKLELVLHVVPTDTDRDSMFWSSKYMVGSDQLRQKVVDRNLFSSELGSTWYWVRKIVKREFRRKLTFDKMGDRPKFISCAEGVGKRGDEAIVMSWRESGHYFEIVDSRIATFLIRGKDIVNKRPEDLFRKFINYKSSTIDKHSSIKYSPTVLSPSGVKYGSFVVERGTATGWFDGRIEFFMRDDLAILAFEKRILPSKTRAEMTEADRWLGGISTSDDRKFVRFQVGARKKMIDDYHRELQNKEKEK